MSQRPSQNGAAPAIVSPGDNGFRTSAGWGSRLSVSTKTWLLSEALLGVITRSGVSSAGLNTRLHYPSVVSSLSQARRPRLISAQEPG